MRTFALIIPILLLAVLSAGLVAPVLAVKGSYPGTNGKIAFDDGDPDPPYDREIFVMDNDGTNIQQLTHNEVHDFNPCWSPDGTKIAFQHGDYPNFQIWVMDADGKNPRQLTTPPSGYADYDPAWSPDGSTIAYGRIEGGDASSFRIFVIAAAGPAGAGTQLINTGSMHPSWSPDGSEIAYNYLSIIYVANASTGALKRTLSGGETSCWSPDGTKIVVEFGNDIWVMNATDGSNRQQLTDGYEDDEPNWSPDGTKIVFMRRGGSIWVMDADGTNEYALNALPNAFRPDYQRLGAAPAPVGGIVSPVSRLEILAPYFTLAALLAVASAVLIMRRGRRD